jgi:hypothetical protein
MWAMRNAGSDGIFGSSAGPEDRRSAVFGRPPRWLYAGFRILEGPIDSKFSRFPLYWMSLMDLGVQHFDRFGQTISGKAHGNSRASRSDQRPLQRGRVA